ncbi:hypothetical protein ACIQXF_04990 [Lysinibacillus sp. NPDC097231]
MTQFKIRTQLRQGEIDTNDDLTKAYRKLDKSSKDILLMKPRL